MTLIFQNMNKKDFTVFTILTDLSDTTFEYVVHYGFNSSRQ